MFLLLSSNKRYYIFFYLRLLFFFNFKTEVVTNLKAPIHSAIFPSLFLIESSVFFELKIWIKRTQDFNIIRVRIIFKSIFCYFCYFYNHSLKETCNSYFCVTPKNQVLHGSALLFFR